MNGQLGPATGYELDGCRACRCPRCVIRSEDLWDKIPGYAPGELRDRFSDAQKSVEQGSGDGEREVGRLLGCKRHAGRHFLVLGGLFELRLVYGLDFFRKLFSHVVATISDLIRGVKS